jgi:1-deoxy-D-xylulose-5-phosphate reductoisomerase
LAGRIAFGGIARHVAEAIDAALKDGSSKEPATVAEALGVDHIVRERSRAILAGR